MTGKNTEPLYCSHWKMVTV